MAGNVNEWVQDTYRQTSFDEEEDFNPFRGNEYSNKRLSDPVNGTLAKDKYGHPIKDPAISSKKLKYSELIAQEQAAAAQGTAAPGTNGTSATPGAAPAGPVLATQPTGMSAALAGKAYNADQRGYGDTVNTVLYGTTTLANDHSKVYKGGSWNDLAYWLNPAARRFMNEDDASAEVGFRCAMDLVGSAEINPAGKPHFAVKKQKAFKPAQ